MKTLALAGEKFDRFLWESKKNEYIYKNKQKDADSFLHNTTSQTQCLYKLSKC